MIAQPNNLLHTAPRARLYIATLSACLECGRFVAMTDCRTNCDRFVTMPGNYVGRPV
jgi:hypothetical protein